MSEISSLESEQEKLTKQQQLKKPVLPQSSSSSSSSSSQDEVRFKMQLKEKSKLLEEKMKLLRTKETESGKISTQKARLVSEVDTLKKFVEETKRRKAELQRKMRDEQVLHRQEKVQFKQSEVQAKRRELQAQQSVNKLEGQMQNKERVWKAQLESKDRESKQLLELMSKQQVVKSMQAVKQGGSGSSSSSVPSAAGLPLILQQQLLAQQAMTTKAALDIKLWVEQELELQTKRATTQDELDKEMSQRNIAVKQLQEARAANSSSSLTSSITTSAAIKALENEIHIRSSSMAQLKGVLADLGNKSSADKKRFSRFTELRESKLASEVLFEVAYKAQKKEHLMSKKMHLMQEQLLRCKKQLENANASVLFYQQAASASAGRYEYDDDELSERGEMDETFYPSDEDDDADASECSDDDDEYCGTRKARKPASAVATTAGTKRKATAAVTFSSSSSENSCEGADGDVGDGDDDAHQQAYNKRKKGRTSKDTDTSADNDQAESDADDDSGDNSDTDGSDSDSGTGKRKRSKKAPAAAKVSKSKAAAGDNAKKIRRVQVVDAAFDDSEITFPLSKHTIKDLKRFLAAKGLTVSGKFTEVINNIAVYDLVYNIVLFTFVFVTCIASCQYLTGVKAELIKRLESALPSTSHGTTETTTELQNKQDEEEQHIGTTATNDSWGLDENAYPENNNSNNQNDSWLDVDSDVEVGTSASYNNVDVSSGGKVVCDGGLPGRAAAKRLQGELLTLSDAM